MFNVYVGKAKKQFDWFLKGTETTFHWMIKNWKIQSKSKVKRRMDSKISKKGQFNLFKIRLILTDKNKS